MRIISISMIMFIATGLSFSMGNKVKFVPLKIQENLNVSDGEILYYTRFTGGERDLYVYYVTRLTNEGGKKAIIYS